MEPLYLIFLILITAVITAILAGLASLLRNGRETARLRLNNSNSSDRPAASMPMRWKEDGATDQRAAGWNSAVIQAAGFLWRHCAHHLSTHLVELSNFLRRLSRRTNLQSSLSVVPQLLIADPIDGTYFQQGEPVVRCCCGTTYHVQSWQWIGEKLGGQCVTCKRMGLTSNLISASTN
jgi:hypothetical protein